MSNKWLSTANCVVFRGKTFKPHLVPTPSGGPRRDPPADFLISGAKILGGQSASKKKPRFGLAPQAVGANEGEMSERGENAMFEGKSTRSKNCRSVWVKLQGLHRICVCWVASRNGFEHGSCSVCFFFVSWTCRALNQRTCQETTVKFGIFGVIFGTLSCQLNLDLMWQVAGMLEGVVPSWPLLPVMQLYKNPLQDATYDPCNPICNINPLRWFCIWWISIF